MKFIIERIISKYMIDRAYHRLENFIFNRKEQSKFGADKERTLVGYVGEFMVMEHLKVDDGDDDYEYDIIYRNKKIEIKSISCKFKPHLDYLCTVNSFDPNGMHKQDADYYIFTRIKNDLSEGWILGFIKCKEFFEKGLFVKKDSNVIPGVRFSRANATTLPIIELNPIENIVNI